MKTIQARTPQYHNIFEFALDVFGVARDQLDQVQQAERASSKLFRHSPRGLGICPLGHNGKRVSMPNTFVWGIKVTGIVEGTDIEASGAALMFPFDQPQFWESCEAVSAELDDAEAEWNAQGESA